jgi:hypothetical protein
MFLVDLTDLDSVHRRVCAIREERAALDHELGSLLLVAEALGVPASLGFASTVDYAARYCGFDRREARERLRVARALESLPVMAESLKDGSLAWSAVRELTRVADERTEDEWLAAARGRTVREVERMVAQHEKGDRPTDPPKPDPPRRLPYEVCAATWALLQEARAALTKERGGSVSDDDFMETLARTLLAGGSGEAVDTGRAPYQIAITVCERCRTATQRAGSEDVVIDQAALECAECDAQNLGRVDDPSPPRASQTIPPRIRRAVIERDGGRCVVPGCNRSAFVDVHHNERRADGGTHDPNKMCTLCTGKDGHHPLTHRGKLVIRGTFSTGFTFWHADGSPYGSTEASPARSKVLAKVLEILVGMGFKQREAQGMVDRAAPHVGHDASVDEALREALRQARLPSSINTVREQTAEYVRLCA